MGSADNLRANSKLTSSDYFMPVLGVIFLRHAANRFEVAAKQIEEDQASGRMPKRKVLPADYIRRRALWLPEPVRYDYIMAKATSDPAGLPTLVTEAMNAIEADFEPLSGVLPKDYGIFEPKEAKRRFEIMARELFARMKVLILEPSIRDYYVRYDNIESIYKKLEENRNTADVTEVLKALHRIVNEAVRTHGLGEDQAEGSQIDLSTIDFEKLRDEFAKKVSRKHLTLQRHSTDRRR